MCYICAYLIIDKVPMQDIQLCPGHRIQMRLHSTDNKK